MGLFSISENHINGFVKLVKTVPPAPVTLKKGRLVFFGWYCVL